MRFFRAWLFCCEKNNQELRNPGIGKISDMKVSRMSEKTAATFKRIFGGSALTSWLPDSIIMSENNGQLPNSKKIYVSARLHPDIRVPFREISLAPTKSINGEIEINEPVRVYDTSGPWGDPDFHGDVTQGLPPLRAKWIRERGDIEEINGRAASPRDDGYFSEVHRTSANGNDGGSR